MSTHEDPDIQHARGTDGDQHYADALAHAEQAAAKNIPINYGNAVTWRTLEGVRVNLVEISPEYRTNILRMLERLATSPSFRSNYIMMVVNTLVNAEVRPGEASAIIEQLLRVDSLDALSKTPLAKKLVALNAAAAETAV